MFLDTTKKIQAFYDGPKTTTELTYIAAYAEIPTTTFAIGSITPVSGSLNGSTAVDIIGVASASTVRAVKEITIYNADSVQHTITVREIDTATPHIFQTFVVPVGKMLRYQDVTGWQVGETGNGTVTSVAFTGDGTVFNTAVPGSPIVSSGTFAPTLHTQVTKTFLSGPAAGADAIPTFRTIAAADIPSLSATYLPLAGGTMAGAILYPNGSAAAPSAAFNTNYGLFYDTTNVGIGLSMAGVELGWFSAGGLFMQADAAVDFFMTRYSNNGGAGSFTLRKARGTTAVPLVIVQNDVMFTMDGRAYDGTVFRNASVAQSLVTAATPSATNMQSAWQFFTAPAGSVTISVAMQVDQVLGWSMGTTAGTTVIDFTRHWVASTTTANILPVVSDAVTAAVTVVSNFTHQTSGTAAAGFGARRTTTLENGNGSNVAASHYDITWTTVTNGAEVSDFALFLKRAGADTEALHVTGGGLIYGTALHNNAVSPTGTTNQYIASGTYTPTLNNTTNVAASTAFACQWMRVANVVTVSGKVNVDPTAAGATTLGITLPIASNLAADQQCSGTAFSAAVAGLGAAIIGDTTNDRATMQWTAVDISARDMFFTFTYVIL